MKVFRGTSAYPAIAVGPAFVINTWSDLVAVAKTSMPVVVVAPYLDERQLGIVDLRHVYGFVFERGSLIDPMFPKLEELPKASVLGAHGAYEAIDHDDIVIVDSIQGVVVKNPELEVLDSYMPRKGARGMRLDALERQALDRLAGSIQTSRLYKGYLPPLDLPEDRGRLLAIVRKVAQGEPPSAQDDEYIRALIDAPPPTGGQADPLSRFLPPLE